MSTFVVLCLLMAFVMASQARPAADEIDESPTIIDLEKHAADEVAESPTIIDLEKHAADEMAEGTYHH